MNLLVDTHAHLDFPIINNSLGEIIKECKNNNVEKIISICTNTNNIDKIFNISNQYDNIFFTIGTHPCEVNNDLNFNNTSLLKKWATKRKCVGIGECGLDYFHNLDFVEKQKSSFISQINAARENNLPIVIHSRNADDDMIDLLQDNYNNGSFSGVIHCFSSSKKLAKIALDLGLYISFSGIVTFNNASEVKNIATYVPDDRILVETDAPYLSPEPLRGRSNKPSYCLYTGKLLANLRNLSFKKFSEITDHNSHLLFKKLKIKDI